MNFGVPDDYEKLDRLGISVKGAIVIARYGGSWRGIKPKVAAEHGAVGCLIYSDPHEDGYFQGDVFPDGPYRNPGRRAARQRHGHAGLSRRSADARRRRDHGRQAARPRSDAATLTKIPVLPISYGDAQPLLAALDGSGGAGRRGAARCRITYHVGPGPGEGAPEARVQLGPQAALQRDRAHSRRPPIPTSGSSAAIITTPG